MPFVGAILGLVVATLPRSFTQFLWGGAIGFLFAVVLNLRERLTQSRNSLEVDVGGLRRELEQLKRRIEELSPREAAPAQSAPEPERRQEVIQEPAPRASQEVLPEPIGKLPPMPELRAPGPGQPVRKEEHLPGSDVLKKVIAYFSTGNTIAKVGVVLLFLGVAFLLKYVSDQGLFPIELRLFSTALGSVVLLGLGWKLRADRGPFGLLLQGGGIGIFYLTVFASFRLYQLIPAPAAFALLFAVVVLSSFLAVLQNSRALAVYGLTGGFLAPIAVSTGQGSHVALFSYYAILNLGILGMSWFRSWRELNLVGFTFTFVIGSIWGAQYYKPEFFATTEPFLLFFFTLYFAVGMIFAGRKLEPQDLVVDSALVFGTPIVSFALQSALVKDMAYGLAWSAVCFGALYLVAARTLFRRAGEKLRLLVEAQFGIGVCFLTLAVPFALDGKWTAAVWALEGAAVLWSGLRQGRYLARCSGVALQVLASCAFLVSENRPPSLTPIVNPFFMGTLVLSLSLFLSGLFVQRAEESRRRGWEKQIVPVFLAGCWLWWGLGGVIELNQAVPVWYHDLTGTEWHRSNEQKSVYWHALVLFFSGSTLLFHALSRRLKWEEVGLARFALPSLLAILALLLLAHGSHPLANLGAVAWPVALLIHYRVLRTTEFAQGARLSPMQHCSALWLLTFLATWEAYHQIDKLLPAGEIWAEITLSLVPSALALLVIRWKKSDPWPVGPNRPAYMGAGVVPNLAWVVVWTAFLNFTNSGNPWYLPYFPVANPIDVTQIFVLLTLACWFIEARKASLTITPRMRDFAVLAGITTFIWLTAGLTRTLHHWAGLPWDFASLFASNLMQAALSIFWSIVALALMLLATRRRWRVLWISGASLLGIVVIKLFLVDLSGRGTLERVISFIGTGVLLLVVGYFAPIPPDAQVKKEEA